MLRVYDLENKLHSQTSWHLAFELTLLPMRNATMIQSGSNTGWGETGYTDCIPGGCPTYIHCVVGMAYSMSAILSDSVNYQMFSNIRFCDTRVKPSEPESQCVVWFPIKVSNKEGSGWLTVDHAFPVVFIRTILVSISLTQILEGRCPKDNILKLDV